MKKNGKEFVRYYIFTDEEVETSKYYIRSGEQEYTKQTMTERNIKNLIKHKEIIVNEEDGKLSWDNRYPLSLYADVMKLCNDGKLYWINEHLYKIIKH
jgi:hypothetical protein